MASKLLYETMSNLHIHQIGFEQSETSFNTVGNQQPIEAWAQLFKINDIVSERFVKISNLNITNSLLFFVDKM